MAVAVRSARRTRPKPSPMPDCKCDKSFHPQPVSYDTKGNLKPLSHKCGVCGTTWPYGSKAPKCLGPGVV